DSGYKATGGLHGVGVSVVNALSEWLVVEVHRNGRVYRQRYARGVPQTDVEDVGESDSTGTFTHFMPDGQVFETLDFNTDHILTRLRELAFLNRGVRIHMRDERTAREARFKYEGGIISFVEHLNKTREVLHKDVI